MSTSTPTAILVLDNNQCPSVIRKAIQIKDHLALVYSYNTQYVVQERHSQGRETTVLIPEAIIKQVWDILKAGNPTSKNTQIREVNLSLLNFCTRSYDDNVETDKVYPFEIHDILENKLSETVLANLKRNSTSFSLVVATYFLVNLSNIQICYHYPRIKDSVLYSNKLLNSSLRYLTMFSREHLPELPFIFTCLLD